jgi:hypothetical protein
MVINKLGLLLTLLTAASLLCTAFGQNLVSSLSVTFCGFVSGIRAIIGIIALCLFLVGGVTYAIAHFLPSSLDYRKNLISWATAMIIGGIIGLIVVVVAQPVINLIAGFGNAAGGTMLPVTSC